MAIILLLSGPNLNLLGEREPEHYGTTTLDDLVTIASEVAAKRGYDLEHVHSNHEGALIDAIHVCALFNMIVRLADSLGWDIPPPEAFAARGRVLLESGYRLRGADEIRAL